MHPRLLLYAALVAMTGIGKVVSTEGCAPPTVCAQGICSTRLSYVLVKWEQGRVLIHLCALGLTA